MEKIIETKTLESGITAKRAERVYSLRAPAPCGAPTDPPTTNSEEIQPLDNECDSVELEHEDMAKEIIDEVAENIREEVTSTRVGTKKVQIQGVQIL